MLVVAGKKSLYFNMKCHSVIPPDIAHMNADLSYTVLTRDKTRALLTQKTSHEGFLGELMN